MSLTIHRLLEGEHTEGHDCWCAPVVVRADDCTIEELIDALRDEIARLQGYLS